MRSRVVLAVAALLALAVPAVAQAGSVDTRPEFVIAVLGDSYASGEGAPDVHGNHSLGGDLLAVECADPNPLDDRPVCFSETWWSPDAWFSGRRAVFPQQDDAGWQADARRCHRSTKGPAAHAGMLIANRFRDVEVTILNFSCGGSKLTDGLLLGYPGAEPPAGASNMASQLARLQSFVAGTSRQVDAIVVNIGGNDSQFADLVVHCLLIDPVNDCANDQLLRDVGQVLVDGAAPAFPDPAAPLSERYRVMDAAIRGLPRPSGVVGLSGGARPDEVYLTTLPNPSHDAPPVDNPGANPQDLCDGTQSSDPVYDNAKLGEALALENLVAGMNDAMARAAGRHGWILVPLFDLARDHGVCADEASFFRTNADALRIQGDEGLPIFAGLVGPPNFQFDVSPGIAHQNEAGYAARAAVIADVVEEQLRMRFTAPTLNLDGVQAGASFSLSWTDPSPAHAAETRWHLELQSPGQLNPAVVLSDGPASLVGQLGETPLAGGGRFFTWQVPRTGEFTARLKACRATPTGFYCGPFSNALTISTTRPGTPVELRRVASVPFSLRSVRVTWSPGPATTASTRYEVRHGRFGPLPCPPSFPSGATCGFGMTSPTTVSTTSTVFQQANLADGSYAYAVRACTTAGCSAFTPQLVVEVRGIKVAAPVVGTFGLRAPQLLPVGKPSLLEIEWRTPRRWTDLDRVELVVRDGRKQVGTIRFTQDDGVLWVAAGRRQAFGHPDTEGRIAAGPLALDLARSAVVRFGPSAKRVGLRVALVPTRALRGKTLTFELGGRDDRGRTQAAAPAGGARVR